MEQGTDDFPTIADEIPHPLKVAEFRDPVSASFAASFLAKNPDVGGIMPNVLVHCQLGCSRSATVVAAHLMHMGKTFPPKLRAALGVPMHHDTGVPEVVRFLKTRRPNIRPNPSFQMQLRLWDNMGRCTFDPSRSEYRSFRAANKKTMDAVVFEQRRIAQKVLEHQKKANSTPTQLSVPNH